MFRLSHGYDRIGSIASVCPDVGDFRSTLKSRRREAPRLVRFVPTAEVGRSDCGVPARHARALAVVSSTKRFPGSIGLNVVYRRVSKRPLYVSVGLGCFGMCAEIVAKYEQCFPTRIRWLHQMHMMRPRPGRPLSKKQLTGKP